MYYTALDNHWQSYCTAFTSKIIEKYTLQLQKVVDNLPIQLLLQKQLTIVLYSFRKPLTILPYSFYFKNSWKKYCMAFECSLTNFWYRFIFYISWQLSRTALNNVYRVDNLLVQLLPLHWQSYGTAVLKTNPVDKVTIQPWPS